MKYNRLTHYGLHGIISKLHQRSAMLLLLKVHVCIKTDLRPVECSAGPHQVTLHSRQPLPFVHTTAHSGQCVHVSRLELKLDVNTVYKSVGRGFTQLGEDIDDIICKSIGREFTRYHMKINLGEGLHDVICISIRERVYTILHENQW